jgi:hypothetical protein
VASENNTVEGRVAQQPEAKYGMKPKISIWKAGDQARQLYFMVLYLYLTKLKSEKRKPTSASGQAEMGVMKKKTFQAALVACAIELTMLGYFEYTQGSKTFPDSALELVGMKGLLDLWEAVHWFAVLLNPAKPSEGTNKGLHMLLPPPTSIQKHLSFMRVCIEDALGWQPDSGVLDAMLNGGGKACLSIERMFSQLLFHIATIVTNFYVIFENYCRWPVL